MAYNAELAERIRHMLAEAEVADRTREQKMFGGLSFLRFWIDAALRHNTGRQHDG